MDEEDDQIDKCPECGGLITEKDQHGACLDEAQSRAE